jgi:hypothetical protein
MALDLGVRQPMVNFGPLPAQRSVLDPANHECLSNLKLQQRQSMSTPT